MVHVVVVTPGAVSTALQLCQDDEITDLKKKKICLMLRPASRCGSVRTVCCTAVLMWSLSQLDTRRLFMSTDGG